MTITDRQNFVLHTMVMRLSEKDTLLYLKSKGHDIKRATLSKDKKAIRDEGQKRKFELAKYGLWDSHIQRIDQIELSISLAWENYNIEEDPYKKVKILSMITSMQPLLSNYLSASQAIIENDNDLRKIFTK